MCYGFVRDTSTYQHELCSSYLEKLDLRMDMTMYNNKYFFLDFLRYYIWVEAKEVIWLNHRTGPAATVVHRFCSFTRCGLNMVSVILQL